MPIPKRQPNEKQDDYMARCLRAIAKENMPDDQKKAICYEESRKRYEARLGGGAKGRRDRRDQGRGET